MAQILLQEFHALLIDHLSMAGLPKNLLNYVSEGISTCTMEDASRSKLFNVFEYVQTGVLKVTIQELNGDEHIIRADSQTRVQDLKIAIEQKNGPCRKRQRLVYQTRVLRNADCLATYKLTPVQSNVSLIQVQPERLYVIGRGEVQFWDTNESAWTSLSSMAAQPPLYSAQAIGIGGKLYFHGHEVEHVLKTVVRVYDPVVDSWSALPPPSERYRLGARGRAALVATEDKLFMIGGVGGEARDWDSLASGEVFDLRTGTWASLPAMNVARCDFALVELNRRIYASGGATAGDEWAALTSAEVYDLSTHAWSSLPPMSVGRRSHAAAAIDDKLYVWGGCCYDEELSDGKMLESGEVYDPVTNSWTSLPSMSKGRHNFALVALDGKIWAIANGGDVEIFDTVTKSWSSGPSPACTEIISVGALKICCEA
eukprot:gnl/TRDRNA2_/TRDRNA2_126017_c0_seq2.p1 gnl/TRDRNA2_/TRDRNA2_126017_c0~~gnl/TRDRNA2_/TRDRNA2_126017_c0_seq2.p1  ORF type:complete len:427 (+),score=42.15 gnl/TRDRNA2_/TRDRNA2_126017_c0_seq2:59-1339(+)